MHIHDATPEERDIIDRNLVLYNHAQVPFTQEKPFVSIARCVREGDEVVGGILAQVYCWNVLYIDVLWVREDRRNRGIASALVRDVEEQARGMGCRLAHLDTFDFQAKGLYERLGYAVFGVLEGCPEGHARYYMSRMLGAGA